MAPAYHASEHFFNKKMRGRPTSFKPEYIQQAFDLCSRLGATQEDLAHFFKVTTRTIEEWISVHPEFSRAVKDGSREWDTDRVEKALKSRAIGYSHKAEKIFLDRGGNIVRAEYIEHYPPDPTSMIFWLKNRRRLEWSDKQEHEHIHKHEELTDEQLAERIAEAIASSEEEGSSETTH